MSCIATSVGLGNIWRFPFVAYENGGGAFIIPYVIVLFIIGKPMYYLEMIIGQFTSKSSVKMWDMSPVFRGVGIGQLVGIAFIMTYYCSLIGVTTWYFLASFASELPWATCQESWGKSCVDAAATRTTLLNNSLEQSVSSSELYFL